MFDDDDNFGDDDDRWEAAREEHYDKACREWVRDNAEELAKDFFEENYAEAVEAFRSERLNSYYVAHTDVVVPALGALKYSRLLSSDFPQAALVFAVSSVEITLKYGVLKPVISGLVHAEELASLIADEATSGTGIVRFDKLLLGILKEITKVQFAERKRVDSRATLWEEICKIQTARNKLIHQGLVADIATVELSIAVADTTLNEIFPEILNSFGLHLHDSTICDKVHPTAKPGLPT
jgi:hypothetical protein